ncbi:uncharacterized protein LOC126737690 [Anthonomus grandis grandis]|uniref:uncharacterized protein LOC126737690 n=1 Tax=Anthonomus grandis grandis TaxID=2921223 RepID=UPI002164F450|nr:uncharacterized protein LOC126737690 [Anthonomus grandis grandis]XP_050298645.1 uncharacterized protein LOC126737690 [Anthonomus grandis grandis]XP_050298646.1 uncharacterized protein LOC126737690 [Anthonomus grandis grandis]XP_050298647.1 uncharacterized protein LOC126737690 [Anthonomus grandis grandis]XP_050298648.1 uncharacterized protein LOC126737690 [Anthonomus grandis grandis]
MNVNQFLLCPLIFVILTPTIMAECPRLCECKWKYGKESVICQHADLNSVPPVLDSGTQILDLRDNPISSLKNGEFSNAGLVNLQKIFIAKCNLKTIERYAFKDLINLVELDLSYNQLSTIPTDSFESISELRELHLNNNPIQIVSNAAFSSVPQLFKLDLSSCKINKIDLRAFVGLEDSLKWLKLDNNRLTEVEATSFTILRNLHGLELSGNPWNCSCKLGELRNWMLRQNVPYDIPPICQAPKRLQDKSWKMLDLDEFACSPKIYSSEGKTHGVEGKNVTISCNIDGIPRPDVKWLLRNKVLMNISGAAPLSGKKLYIVNQKLNVSELTIYSAELQDAGTYMCVAENKAGKSEAVVTLTVAKNNSDIQFSHKLLIIGLLFGIILTFSCCLIAAGFISVRKKRLLKWHSEECGREDNYEKIELKQKVCQRSANGGVSKEDNALITIPKKNGDYSVVPGVDTDHENDEEEESTLEITTPGTSNEKKWTNEEQPNQVSASAMGTSTPSKENEVGSRDNIRKNPKSTYGTSNTWTTNENPVIHTTAPAWKTIPNPIYSMTNVLRQVPDVVGHSSYSQNNKSRTQSENGSANDINELFCTLPRKRDLLRYKSSDSQSPLLPESRYASTSSSESFTRRASIEAQRYPLANSIGKSRAIKKSSGSMLNLTRDDKVSNFNATPLLDVKCLETRLSPMQDLHTLNSNPYDYHAAQLEKFLEEYRVLQKQLTKMKETCDTICQEQMKDSVSTPSSSSGVSSYNISNKIISSPNSNSIQDSVDFKKFESELTKYLMARSPTNSNNLTPGTLRN